ncbi:MAG TPA: OmpH family outer membrane protein [Limnochorda sp.]
MKRGTWGRLEIIVARGAACAALLAAVFLFAPAAAGAETGELRVGYVDLQVIQAQYLFPNMYGPRAALEQRLIELQAEFDEKSVGMDDEAKQALFNAYQEELNAQSAEVQRFEQELRAKVAEAIAAVAQEHGVVMVLAKDVILNLMGERGVPAVVTQPLVLYGGTDLTPAVLRRLGVRTAPTGGD